TESFICAHRAHSYRLLFLLVCPCPPVSTLFPYTTLFRSVPACGRDRRSVEVPGGIGPELAQLGENLGSGVVDAVGDVDAAVVGLDADQLHCYSFAGWNRG